MVRVEIPDDPLDWRPQEPLVTRTPVTIRDPIVEVCAPDRQTKTGRRGLTCSGQPPRSFARYNP